MDKKINSFNYKLVILGDSSVGKSSLASRHINKRFNEFNEPTIGASFFSSSNLVNDKEIKLEIWDTAGQERYKSLAPMYYRGANVALVVFDITNKESFNNAFNWIRELKERTNNCLIYLAGNKCDRQNDRQVSIEDVNDTLKTYDINYLETSAKCDINIDKLFKRICLDLSNRNIDEEPKNPILVNNIPPTKKFKCCN
ncbi:Ras family [seawater metagenome]|uniref:Ras family n=1 Tax=seawater metagenome TaxID=1561972 RepID=A0A5E8CJQ4_9ZZZZ